jgi:serine protease Do
MDNRDFVREGFQLPYRISIIRRGARTNFALLYAIKIREERMKLRVKVSVFVVSVLVLFNLTAYCAYALSDVHVAKELSQAFSEVAKKASPAVVFVQVEKMTSGSGSPFQFNDPFDLFNDDFFERFFRNQRPEFKQKKYRQMGQGSGFIISKDGLILTNNHVVGDADTIIVRLKDGREFKAEVVGTDPKSDVAVVKITTGEDLPVVPLGNSDNLELGEWVIAIGNPFGLLETVTVGVVSAKGRSNVGIADYENFIQTDAAINPGNSGGPLLNLDGEAVGINTAIFSRSGGYMGIGFSIPVNMAVSIKDQLIAKGKVTRGYLGIIIQPLSQDMAKSFGLNHTKGVLVSEVASNSPAEEGGLKSGDIITELDGKEVEDVSQFRNTIAMINPGQKVALGIFRDKEVIHKDIVVGTLPEDGKEAKVSKPRDQMTSKFGFSVQNLTPELADRFSYEMDEGVIITRVEDGSPAEFEGLEPGQLIISVNNKKVKSVDEFNKAVKESEEPETILLRVKAKDYSRYVLLKANK